MPRHALLCYQRRGPADLSSFNFSRHSHECGPGRVRTTRPGSNRKWSGYCNWQHFYFGAAVSFNSNLYESIRNLGSSSGFYDQHDHVAQYRKHGVCLYFCYGQDKHECRVHQHWSRDCHHLLEQRLYPNRDGLLYKFLYWL